MANQTGLDQLLRERDKHQTALSNTSERIAAIQAEEERKRQEQEQKERALAILGRKREGFQRWICETEREIAALKEKAARQINIACEDQSGGLFRLKETVKDLTIAERMLEALKEYEPAGYVARAYPIEIPR